MTQDTGEVYFYTIAAEGNGPRSASLSYRSDGYTIIMSCGQIEEEGFDTKEAAEARKNDVSFTLSLEGGPLQPDSGRYVKALSSGWHIVQSFHLPALDPGTYALVGTSAIGDVVFRTNLVNLTVR